MISRPSLKNSARAVLCSIGVSVSLIAGCTSSTAPTYTGQNVAPYLENICKKEYNLTIKSTLVGSTLWVYLPLKNITGSPEPGKDRYIERFEIDKVDFQLPNTLLKGEYMIKPVYEREKYQELALSKEVFEKINNAWKACRRVLFSMARSKDEPLFLGMVIADVQNGYEIVQISYIADIKKVSYDYISWNEFQHRTPQEISASEAVIGDEEGRHFVWYDITLKDFIIKQIIHRVRLKFGKPEVSSDADVDKEIIKIIIQTLGIYDFKQMSEAELYNLFSGKAVMLDHAQLWPGQAGQQ